MAAQKKPSEKDNAKIMAKQLKNRNHVNLSRKVTHAAVGLVFAILNSYLPRWTFLTGITLLSTATLTVELLRYTKGFHWIHSLYYHGIGSQLRQDELQSRFVGSMYFFWGVTWTAAAAALLSSSSSNAAASMGMIQLAIADPCASFFGEVTRNVQWSRIKNGLGGLGRNKGILGFLGGAVMCFPFNYLALRHAAVKSTVAGENVAVGDGFSVSAASLAIGLAGSLADLAVPTPSMALPRIPWLGDNVPSFHLDDNVVIPLFSAWACLPIFAAMGWHSLTLSPFVFV